MARHRAIGRKSLAGMADLNRRKREIESPDAFSVREFCERHRISQQLFYKLRHKGLMPHTFRVGSRTLVSREAASAWRREREAANNPHSEESSS
jgi:hypothetical protein